MEKLSNELVLDLLRKIVNPITGYDVISEKTVKEVVVGTEVVSIVMEIDANQIKEMTNLKSKVINLIENTNSTYKCQVILTAHNANKVEANHVKARPPIPEEPKIPIQKRKPVFESLTPPGVKRVIAIASGKGGVGKSTVAANLAVALAIRGKKIGLLDADVYGPSQPRMFGLSGRPVSIDGKTIQPLSNHGVTVMSLGLMVPENQAIVWRGPKLMGALQQMLGQVEWGQLDLLIVDLPPGTGDVQLTLSQKTDLSGAIVVSTPQDIALLDARKGIDMFQKLNVPILGLIENMSSFTCTGCGMIHHPFSSGTLKSEAEKLGTAVLVDLPLDLETRIAADQGVPIVIKKPESDASKGFLKLADKLLNTKLFTNS